MAGTFFTSAGNIFLSVRRGFIALLCIFLFSFYHGCTICKPGRCGIITYETLASKPATGKEVIVDLATQCPHESVLESVQLIKGRTIRVVFP